MNANPVNPAVLENLEAIAGSDKRDFMRTLIDSYLSDTEARLAAMREAARSGDPATLARKAHSIMGSSLGIGAEALAALMRESAIAGKSGLLPGPDRLRDCEAEFIRVKTALLAFLA